MKRISITVLWMTLATLCLVVIAPAPAQDLYVSDTVAN